VFLKAVSCYLVDHTISNKSILNRILGCSKGICYLSVIPVIRGKVILGGEVDIDCSFMFDLELW